MTLVLRRIAIENFRKFRAPVVVDGLTPGLNILIEPNETGKSTLLAAVRAALFLKHNSKTQLIQSFLPHGDTVGPQVALDFDVVGQSYSLTKRFLSRPVAELQGPTGRSAGDAAEQALQALLGFEQGRGGFDADLQGALGMLWVAQTEGLWVTPPGGRVQSAIRATLEREVGTILGGAGFERIRARIEEEARAYVTPTGQPTGRQREARAREEQAAAALTQAELAEQALEQAFADLDLHRQQLRSVQRDLADEAETTAHQTLLRQRETARHAAQALATAEARHHGATGHVARLADLARREVEAQTQRAQAEAEREQARKDRVGLIDLLVAAKERASHAGRILAEARALRQATRTALAQGQAREAADQRRVAIAAARERHGRLIALEQAEARAQATARRRLPDTVLAELDRLEQAITAGRATLAAGSARVELIGASDGLLLNGAPMGEGEWTLTQEARITLGDGAHLVLRPPLALAGAQAGLDDALARRDAMLAQGGVSDLAAARRLNEQARDAMAEAKGLAAQIAALTPADRALGLAAGAAALKLFMAGDTAQDEPPAEGPPLTTLKTQDEQADIALTRAEEANTQALDALRGAQQDEAPLALAEAKAEHTITQADLQLANLAADPAFAGLAPALVAARQDAADLALALDQARANARAYDEAVLDRQIKAGEARRASAEDRRHALDKTIAALEARVESEGGKGLAERAAAARDEAGAARAALARVSEEADTLRVLRAALGQAQTDLSRSLVGPVARRAARYVGRILPGGEPGFGDDLALTSLRRGAGDEPCGDLSQGTQEQLAMLSRLAFADMLREEGRPVSLILDDPLAYADDTRLDAMIDLLAQVATRMQVIVLTCRERAFRHVAGTRIVLG